MTSQGHANVPDVVEVEVLYTSDCPNAGALQAYLAAQPDVSMTATAVVEDGPVPVGFAGSPTVLVNGTNPFGGRPVEAAACALSPPSVADVAAVLDRLRAG